MWGTGVFWFLSILVSIQGFGSRGFHYAGARWYDDMVISVEPPRFPVEEKWIEQPLDHFDVSNNRTWLMRFYENDELFNKNGPIFIMLGGEWEITPKYLLAGTLYENAKAHGAMMYYTEHRYYGESRPVSDTSVENLSFLTVEQALADVALFIETKKQELNIPDSPVIVFGVSYSGNMAAWARMKYPHLIRGALASSAPVRAKADVFEYFDAVRNSLNAYDKDCADNTKAAFSVIEEHLTGETADPKKLKEDFNLCDVPDISNPGDLGLVIYSHAKFFGWAVQYNSSVESGDRDIAKLCDDVVGLSKDATYYRFANTTIHSWGDLNCSDFNYTTYINTYRNTSWGSPEETLRQWNYQRCTEFGQYPTTNSPKSIFGKHLPIEYYIQECKDLFGESFDLQRLQRGIERTNKMFGADVPDVRNVIFTNGDADPWHSLGVLRDLNNGTHAILIKGSSHHADMEPERSRDVEGLKEARHKIASIISEWLNPTQPSY